MKDNKNILIINDMCGYGKVALAAMLPILSSMGCHEVQGFLFSRPLPLEEFQQKLDAVPPPRGDGAQSSGKSSCGCRS